MIPIPWLVFAAIYLMIGVGVSAENNQEAPNSSVWFLWLIMVIWPVALGILIQRASTALAKR